MKHIYEKPVTEVTTLSPQGVLCQSTQDFPSNNVIEEWNEEQKIEW